MAKCILISNYEYDKQESMQRFANCLQLGLDADGLEVETLTPRPFFGRLKPSNSGLGKWLGYIDKFILFPFQLCQKASKAKKQGDTVFHICDHSNAMYTRWLRDVPHLVTCHDLLAIRSALGEVPQNPTGWTGKQLQSWILKSLSRSRRIICVSRSTANDLQRLTQHTEASTAVIYNGLNYPYIALDKESCESHLNALFNRLQRTAPSKYLFHIGGSQWYKNRIGLLTIYAALVTKHPETPPLLIAGKPHIGACDDFISQNALQEKVFYVGRVSNQELNALYSGADAFLFPSLAEGFGWPIIEALSSGCPVVTTKRPPMNEIGGSATLYIDPDETRAAADAIHALTMESPDLRSERIQSGLQHAKAFSSEAMVAAYIEEYKSLLK